MFVFSDSRAKATITINAETGRWIARSLEIAIEWHTKQIADLREHADMFTGRLPSDRAAFEFSISQHEIMRSQAQNQLDHIRPIVEACKADEAAFAATVIRSRKQEG